MVKIDSLRLDMELFGDNFLWRFYGLYLKNWEFFKFYCDNELWALLNLEVDKELVFFVKCLMFFELVGVDCIV